MSLIVPCRVAVLDKVTDFLFLLGKLLIVGSVGECGHPDCSEPLLNFHQAPGLLPWHPAGWEGGPFPIAKLNSRLCPRPGILAFFFFTHRIRIVQDTAPPLNYYWVPILVWTFQSRPQQEGGLSENKAFLQCQDCGRLRQEDYKCQTSLGSLVT